MEFYFGPNRFKTLQQQGYDLEKQVDLGWGPLKIINRFAVSKRSNLALQERDCTARKEGERNRMKAAVYHGLFDVRVEEVPEPSPLGPDEVLLAPLVGSLCGTDVTEFVAGPKMIPLHHAHPVSEHQGAVVGTADI